MAGNTSNGVTFVLKTDASGVKPGVDQTKAAFDDLGQSAASAGKQASAGLDAASKSSQASATSAKSAASAYSAQGAALAALLGKIDPTVAALGKLDDLQSQLGKFKAAGALGSDDFAVYATKINTARDALSGAGDAASHLTLNSAGTRQEIGRLAAEMARGDFTRFEGSLATLASRTGILTAAFSPLGVGIAGAVGLIAGLAAAYVAGQRESDAFNKGLIATGNYAGTSVGQLRDLASAIGASTGQYGDAQEALTKLASSGKLSGDALTEAAQGAVSLSQLTGESVDKSVAEFDKFAKDPIDAITKLNDSYHFLTGSVYDQIKALQDQGDQEAATSLAVKTAADALDQRRQQIVDSAGSIEKAWLAVKTAVGGAIDNLKQVGRTDLQGQLQSAYAQQSNIDDQRQEVYGGGVAGFLDNLNPNAASDLEKQKADNDALIKSLQDRIAAQDKADTDAGKQQQLTDNSISARKAVDDLTLSLDKQAQKQKALNDLNQNFTKLFADPQAASDPRLQGVTQTANGGFSGGLYDQDVAGINNKFKDPVDKQSLADIATLHEVLDQANKDVQNAYALNDKLADGYSGPWAKAQEDYTKSIQEVATGLIGLRTQYNLGVITADQYAQGQKDLSNTAGLAADQLVQQQKKIAASNKLTGGNPDLVIELQKQHDQLAGLTPAQVAYNKSVAEANDLAAKSILEGKSQQDVASGLTDRLKELADIRDNADVVSIVAQFGSKSEFEQLGDAIDKIKAKLEDATDPKIVDRLTTALGNVRQKMVDGIVTSSQDGLRSLQSLTANGSKAFEAFQVAIDALTVVQAISAVLNQGQGDPYTAFARMAAMAAAVVALGVDIGKFGGGGGPSAQSAEEMQKVQGTGSVLGDTTAQSDSIANATKITADATTQLVGLNRGMLTALQALQSALGAAGNQLAQGAGNATLPGAQSSTQSVLGPLGGIDPLLDALNSDPISNAIGGLLFGGKQKVIDQGIEIVGGQLGDMLNSIVVGAYNTVHTSGGLLGHSSTDTNFAAIGGDFAKQFQLVISSISDAVRQGATALGLLPADVEQAIDKFQIATTQISLQGLDADDQQKALEAVFSQIFDGLAGAVVPFIGQFQHVGEGLGETLVRVATEVQVSQEAFKELGLSVSETDPEKFAQISDGLVQAAGGLDAFITSTQSFVDKFAPDSVKFQNEADALNSGLTQVGLALPATRDGMYALMQSLDATTAAGQAQIATLLSLTDTSDAYYTALENRANSQNQYGDFVEGLAGDSGKLSSFAQSRITIEQWERDTIAQANQLARAAGLQGASEQDLTLIHQVAAQKISEAIAELQSATQDLVDKLYHNGQSVTDSATHATAAVGGFSDAMTQASQAAQSAAQLLLGTLSPLNDTQKLQYALDAFNRGLIGKQDVLTVGQQLYGSTQAYIDLFNSLKDRVDMNTAGGGSVGGGGGGSVSSTSDTDDAAQRHADAQTIAQNVASLANAQHESFDDVASSLHLSLADLAKDLGFSSDQLTDYLNNVVADDNAIPDSLDSNFDRLIAALYQIAGLPPPANTDTTSPIGRGTPTSTDNGTYTPPPIYTGHSTHGLPGLQGAPTTSDTAVLSDVRVLLGQILSATRDGNGDIVNATHQSTTTLAGALRDTTGAVSVLASRAISEDRSGLLQVRRNTRSPVTP